MRISTCLVLLAFPFVSLCQQTLPLIPWPQQVSRSAGSYPLKSEMTVKSNFPADDWVLLFPYLKQEMKKQWNITLSEAAKDKSADIDFFMRRMPTSGKPAYELIVDKKGIHISSNFDEPAFHAIQTLFQLMPVSPADKREVPLVRIFDHARFSYRGMHLDVSRHFSPVSFVKRYIDYLAYHKLNRFHWHLTDDQGWRIEIRKYPALTKTGAWRNGTIIGRYPGIGSDNQPYGGYYTQDEIKEVVQYAKERFIEVIPEIEMPGHGSAAIAAYPWLSCFPSRPTEIPANMISAKSKEELQNGRIKLVQETWGVFDDVFCAGNDSTFMFLQQVIDEVLPLFPSKYFHIGGDECPKTHWKQCPRCQQRIKDLKLKDEHELQSYFVQRMEKYLNSKGKTLIGWDEILEGGLAPNAIVMSWRGEAGGIEAAKQKHEVIMTPGSPLYFDHTQSTNEDSVTIGGYNPIEKVYAYEPVPAELDTESGKYILGAQANLWCEYIKNPRKVEYMIFPRMAALSEVLWSDKKQRNWEGFEKRLTTQFRRYESWKANYSKAYYDIKSSITPSADKKSIDWNTKNRFDAGITNYYRDEKNGEKLVNTTPFQVNESKITISGSGKYKVKSYQVLTQPGKGVVQDKNTPEIVITQEFHFNKATGRPVTLKTEPSKNYPGDGAFTLVNGVQNVKGRDRSGEFIGFSGTDCEAVIDLGVFGEISSVTLHTFHQPESWIYAPAYFEAYSSQDNMYFSRLGTTSTFTETGHGNGVLTIKFPKSYARYVKIFVKNYGLIPPGKPGEGNAAWLFLDEVEVE